MNLNPNSPPSCFCARHNTIYPYGDHCASCLLEEQTFTCRRVGGTDEQPVYELELKASNPKDAIGDTKVPLWLLSPIAKIKWAMAQFAGLIKYGAWNWRAAGVRTSTYLSAMERHMDAFKSGEDYDPTDETDHLGNIMACCAILIDARAAGKLNDDRPPIVSHRAAVAEAEGTMEALKTRYADKTPRHYTIADTDELKT